MTTATAYCLHVENGCLGDDHWPVTRVALELRFGPLSW